MSSQTKRFKPCWVEITGRGPCNRETLAISLPPGLSTPGETLPETVHLCSFHRLELNHEGVTRFFQNYPFSARQWGEKAEMLSEGFSDRNLTFLDPGVLEGVVNSRRQVDSGYMSTGVSGYEDLREITVNLEELSLTDRQLMAVCLVFYGGVKKKRAARAMNISAQALSDHVKAALGKIQKSLCQS